MSGGDSSTVSGDAQTRVEDIDVEPALSRDDQPTLHQKDSSTKEPTKDARAQTRQRQRRRSSFIEEVAIEARYQLKTASAGLSQMTTHKGFRSPEFARRSAHGKRLPIFHTWVSAEKAMLCYQLLFLITFLLACVMYAISYASCWAFVTAITAAITLHGISRLRRGEKRDVLPTGIVRSLSLLWWLAAFFTFISSCAAATLGAGIIVDYVCDIVFSLLAMVALSALVSISWHEAFGNTTLAEASSPMREASKIEKRRSKKRLETSTNSSPSSPPDLRSLESPEHNSGITKTTFKESFAPVQLAFEEGGTGAEYVEDLCVARCGVKCREDCTCGVFSCTCFCSALQNPLLLPDVNKPEQDTL